MDALLLTLPRLRSWDLAPRAAYSDSCDHPAVINAAPSRGTVWQITRRALKFGDLTFIPGTSNSRPADARAKRRWEAPEVPTCAPAWPMMQTASL